MKGVLKPACMILAVVVSGIAGSLLFAALTSGNKNTKVEAGPINDLIGEWGFVGFQKGDEQAPPDVLRKCRVQFTDHWVIFSPAPATQANMTFTQAFQDRRKKVELLWIADEV